MTMTTTRSSTFTKTHARDLAGRVAADLHLCMTLYGKPSEEMILKYLEELVILMLGSYVRKYEFGFRRNGERVVCWRYQVTALGAQVGDRPGGLVPRADVAGARYYNFLSYSQKWFDLPSEDKKAIEKELPIQRTDGELPADGDGTWVADRTYSAGGVSLRRQTFTPRS